MLYTCAKCVFFVLCMRKVCILCFKQTYFHSSWPSNNFFWEVYLKKLLIWTLEVVFKLCMDLGLDRFLMSEWPPSGLLSNEGLTITFSLRDSLGDPQRFLKKIQNENFSTVRVCLALAPRRGGFVLLFLCNEILSLLWKNK